ncbi:unnamed protein product [Linum trigynum]|uniref:Uncharacterized protein n=1 Tax=Linum trigynum TaxID=586398 RepID=A0AAV2G7C9_9ROSI
MFCSAIPESRTPSSHFAPSKRWKIPTNLGLSSGDYCVRGPRSKDSKAKDEAEVKEEKEEAVEEWNRKMRRRL